MEGHTSMVHMGRQRTAFGSHVSLAPLRGFQESTEVVRLVWQVLLHHEAACCSRLIYWSSVIYYLL